MEKLIPGFTQYSVDDMGNVFSHKRGRRLCMRQNETGNGYLDIRLCGGEKHHVFKIHRLVAEAFVLGQSDERNEVNHKDGNKKNNAASNLEWVTRKENIAHRIEAGLPMAVGEQRKSQFKLIGTSLSTGETKQYHSAVVAEQDGFDRKHIYAVLAGRAKSHKGFTFRRI